MRLSIGLELNEHYLKIVTVRHQGIKQAKLFDFIVEPISSLSDEEITRRILEIFRKFKFKPKRLVICLPRNLVTVRNLHLPSQDKEEITQMISLHIGRVVPYKKEEIVFGYQSLGKDEMGYAKELLAIVHIDIIRRQSRILEKAGLYIDNISLSSYGSWQWTIVNCHSEIGVGDLCLLLDVDSAFTDFIIFTKDNLLFSRNIPIKINENFLETDITKFIGEIKQSLVIFQNEEMNKKPNKVFLTGSALARDLYKIIEKELEIPLRVVPQATPDKYLKEKNINIPRDASLIAVSQLTLDESTRSLTFILPEIQIRKSLKEKTKELTIFGTLLTYFFMATIGLFLGRLYNQQAYLKKIQHRITLIKQDVGGLLDQSKKIEFVKEFLHYRRIPLIFLNELQKIVPPEIGIDFISIDEQNIITLRGQATLLSDVFRFVTTLEERKYFKDVETKYTRTKKVKDREITNFEIGLKLNI